MTPWWQGRLVGFDVETTGTDVESDRIVSVAVIEVGGGLPADGFTSVVDPGVPISPEASAVHGITDAMVDGCMPERGAALVIAEKLEDAARDGIPVVAFNARFDLTVLDRALRRAEREPVDPSPFVVDPMVIDKHLDRFRKGRRTLAAICEAYGVDLPADEAHTAGADALAACRAAWVLGARGEVKRRVRSKEEAGQLGVLKRAWANLKDHLPLLHEAQQMWAAQQAVSLRQYFVDKGQVEDAASVSEHWPVVPFKAPVGAADE